MLASGITAQLAIEVLIDEGVQQENITVLNLIVTPQVCTVISHNKIRNFIVNLELVKKYGIFCVTYCRNIQIEVLT